MANVRSFAVCGRAGVGARATQACTNPLLAVDGLELLEDGYGAEEALYRLLDSNYEPEQRQLAIVDRLGCDFPERLVQALEAGQVAGGDWRGRQSAALYIVKTEPYPYLDLRVDEHTDPVAELRRVYEVTKVELLLFIEVLPTRRRPEADMGEEVRGTLLPET